MKDLQNRFNSAAEHVQLLSKESVAESDLLQLYGLYKQATLCGEFKNATKPGFFDFKAKQKYYAWEKVATLGKIQIFLN